MRAVGLHERDAVKGLLGDALHGGITKQADVGRARGAKPVDAVGHELASAAKGRKRLVVAALQTEFQRGAPEGRVALGEELQRLLINIQGAAFETGLAPAVGSLGEARGLDHFVHQLGGRQVVLAPQGLGHESVNSHAVAGGLAAIGGINAHGLAQRGKRGLGVAEHHLDLRFPDEGTRFVAVLPGELVEQGPGFNAGEGEPAFVNGVDGRRDGQLRFKDTARGGFVILTVLGNEHAGHIPSGGLARRGRAGADEAGDVRHAPARIVGEKGGGLAPLFERDEGREAVGEELLAFGGGERDGGEPSSSAFLATANASAGRLSASKRWARALDAAA